LPRARYQAGWDSIACCRALLSTPLSSGKSVEIDLEVAISLKQRARLFERRFVAS
jgi:hypothetical protein